jgi:hypothetical protein
MNARMKIYQFRARTPDQVPPEAERRSAGNYVTLNQNSLRCLNVPRNQYVDFATSVAYQFALKREPCSPRSWSYELFLGTSAATVQALVRGVQGRRNLKERLEKEARHKSWDRLDYFHSLPCPNRKVETDVAVIKANAKAGKGRRRGEPMPLEKMPLGKPKPKCAVCCATAIASVYRGHRTRSLHKKFKKLKRGVRGGSFFGKKGGVRAKTGSFLGSGGGRRRGGASQGFDSFVKAGGVASDASRRGGQAVIPIKFQRYAMAEELRKHEATMSIINENVDLCKDLLIRVEDTPKLAYAPSVMEESAKLVPQLTYANPSDLIQGLELHIATKEKFIDEKESEVKEWMANNPLLPLAAEFVQRVYHGSRGRKIGLGLRRARSKHLKKRSNLLDTAGVHMHQERVALHWFGIRNGTASFLQAWVRSVNDRGRVLMLLKELSILKIQRLYRGMVGRMIAKWVGRTRNIEIGSLELLMSHVRELGRKAFRGLRTHAVDRIRKRKERERLEAIAEKMFRSCSARMLQKVVRRFLANRGPFRAAIVEALHSRTRHLWERLHATGDWFGEAGFAAHLAADSNGRENPEDDLFELERRWRLREITSLQALPLFQQHEWLLSRIRWLTNFLPGRLGAQFDPSDFGHRGWVFLKTVDAHYKSYDMLLRRQELIRERAQEGWMLHTYAGSLLRDTVNNNPAVGGAVGGTAPNNVLQTSLARRSRPMLPVKFVKPPFDGPTYPGEPLTEPQRAAAHLVLTSGLGKGSPTFERNPRPYFRLFVEGEDLCAQCLAMFPEDEKEGRPQGTDACKRCSVKRYTWKTRSSANASVGKRSYVGTRSLERQRTQLRGVRDVDEPMELLLAHASFCLAAPARSWQRLGPKHTIWLKALHHAREWCGVFRSAGLSTVASLMGCHFESLGMPEPLADKLRQFLVTLDAEIKLVARASHHSTVAARCGAGGWGSGPVDVSAGAQSWHGGTPQHSRGGHGYSSSMSSRQHRPSTADSSSGYYPRLVSGGDLVGGPLLPPMLAGEPYRM